jgi:hypothetical protein
VEEKYKRDKLIEVRVITILERRYFKGSIIFRRIERGMRKRDEKE